MPWIRRLLIAALCSLGICLPGSLLPQAEAADPSISLVHATADLRPGSGGEIAVRTADLAVCEFRLASERSRLQLGSISEVSWRWQVPERAPLFRTQARIACWTDAGAPADQTPDEQLTVPLAVTGRGAGTPQSIEPASLSTAILDRPGQDAPIFRDSDKWAQLLGFPLAVAALLALLLQQMIEGRRSRNERTFQILDQHQDQDLQELLSIGLGFLRLEDGASDALERIRRYHAAPHAEAKVLPRSPKKAPGGCPARRRTSTAVPG